MKASNQIKFNYLNKNFLFQDRIRLKSFLVKLFNNEGLEVNTVNYIFCSDEYLLQLNRMSLNHDTYTDIITFPYSKKNEPVFADIYISIDRVKENSIAFSTSFKEELHRVIFHGALHLCDYKDKTPSDIKVMRTKESKCLNSYFVPRET